MKTIYKRITPYFLLLALLVAFGNTAFAQDNKKDREKAKQEMIEKLVKEGNFIFKPETANPMMGRTLNLTSDFDIQLQKDEIRSYLPYFGRAYVAPINPADAGLRFTSNDFTYSVEKRKKHGWDITINPNDVNNVRQMVFTVFDNGAASLQVFSDTRQSISFSGYITKPVGKE